MTMSLYAYLILPNSLKNCPTDLVSVSTWLYLTSFVDHNAIQPNQRFEFHKIPEKVRSGELWFSQTTSWARKHRVLSGQSRLAILRGGSKIVHYGQPIILVIASQWLMWPMSSRKILFPHQSSKMMLTRFRWIFIDCDNMSKGWSNLVGLLWNLYTHLLSLYSPIFQSRRWFVHEDDRVIAEQQMIVEPFATVVQVLEKDIIWNSSLPE